MTVEELIKELEKMPQKALVEVVVNAPFLNKEIGTLAKEIKNKKLVVAIKG